MYLYARHILVVTLHICDLVVYGKCTLEMVLIQWQKQWGTGCLEMVGGNCHRKRPLPGNAFWVQGPVYECRPRKSTRRHGRF